MVLLVSESRDSVCLSIQPGVHSTHPREGPVKFGVAGTSSGPAQGEAEARRAERPASGEKALLVGVSRWPLCLPPAILPPAVGGGNIPTHRWRNRSPELGGRHLFKATADSGPQIQDFFFFILTTPGRLFSGRIQTLFRILVGKQSREACQGPLASSR